MNRVIMTGVFFGLTVLLCISCTLVYVSPASSDSQHQEPGNEKHPLENCGRHTRSLRRKTESMQHPRFILEESGGGMYITEEYDHIVGNEFVCVKDQPFSTFAIDVDRASYSNVRRFIMDNELPRKDAVRSEELINYFDYDYPQPRDGEPFTISTEIGECPWNKKHWLLHIGLQAKKIVAGNFPSNNLVFLIDVSGSMDEPEKLPVLKTALNMLVKNLRNKDRVSIVTYAKRANLVLPPTSGQNKWKIREAIDKLEARGKTAGSEGLLLAYATAKTQYFPEGNNRVICATDGDFNVGVTKDAELVQLIEQKRNDGIFLTVLGFGTENYKDSKLEKLADNGNGNYAHIDNLLEAKKMLVTEIGGTLLTIAKDVKIQVEFNEAKVEGYRLVGYENRMLGYRDFGDDTKDGGELGAGHNVTALYEVVPAGLYLEQTFESDKDELLTLKIRYKEPDEDTSKMVTKTLKKTDDFGYVSEDFLFSSAVAGFGMLLRDSKFKGTITYNEVIELAREGKGIDYNGYRAECIQLMERAEILDAERNK